MGSCPISVKDVTTVDVHAVKGLIASGHRYLDVRTVEEFKKRHLENSLNVPFMFFTPQGRVRNPEFVEQVSSICNDEEEILVGCQSGVRSLQASADLLSAGFQNVKNVGGGIAAWLENGFPVTKPEEKVSDEPHIEEAATMDVRIARGLASSGHHYLDVRKGEKSGLCGAGIISLQQGKSYSSGMPKRSAFITSNH